MRRSCGHEGAYHNVVVQRFLGHKMVRFAELWCSECVRRYAWQVVR